MDALRTPVSSHILGSSIQQVDQKAATAGTYTQHRRVQKANKFLSKVNEVRTWIEEVTHVQLPSFTMKMAVFLSDGILLCKLANKLQPEPIGLRRYKAVDNIVVFLNACRTLGVPRNYVFEPIDLFELKNVVKVIQCLGVLRDIQLGVFDFETNNLTQNTARRLSFCESDVQSEPLVEDLESPDFEECERQFLAQLPPRRTQALEVQKATSVDLHSLMLIILLIVAIFVWAGMWNHNQRILWKF